MRDSDTNIYKHIPQDWAIIRSNQWAELALVLGSQRLSRWARIKEKVAWLLE